MPEDNPAKTESELLFEEYLGSHGYEDWQFEPDLPGQTKKPDYLLPWEGKELLFEVKELHEKKSGRNGGHYDPYKSLRKKIEEARKKFKKLKGFCCSLVVFNVDDFTADLRPEFVFAARLGDLGITISVNTETGATGPTQQAFLGRGKDVRQKTGDPQNTTISSIIVLDRQRVPNPEFEKLFETEVAREEAQLGRVLNGTERAVARSCVFDEHPECPVTRERVPRVVVCENPDARIPLPRDLFQGPYDERWIYERLPPEEGELRRIYIGEHLREQEDGKSAR